MRNPIYDLSNRAYDQLKGSNPEKFQFLITHYYWKEDKYCKEYIAQFSGAAVIFEKSVFQEDLKTCTYPFKKGTGNAFLDCLTTMELWTNTDINGLSTAVNTGIRKAQPLCWLQCIAFCLSSLSIIQSAIKTSESRGE